MLVKTDDDTYINVELQCVDTGDLYSRSVVYASNLIVQCDSIVKQYASIVKQHSMKDKSYDDPRVISIWIIRDKIKSGIINGRISPNRRYINWKFIWIEEIVNYAIPTRWGEGYVPRYFINI